MKIIKSNMMVKTVYFVDFDRTISASDVWDTIVKRCNPIVWKEIIKEYLRGEISSRICNLKLAKLVNKPEPEIRQWVYEIGIDPSFHNFVRWVKEQESEMLIVSDGFDYYIDLLLGKEGLNFLPYFSNRLVWNEDGIAVEFPLYVEECERDMAHCKCRHLGNYPERRRVYIGDGISDTCAAVKCEQIYAKHNLLAYCREHHINCIPFENFQEVIQGEMKQLQASLGMAVIPKGE